MDLLDTVTFAPDGNLAVEWAVMEEVYAAAVSSGARHARPCANHTVRSPRRALRARMYLARNLAGSNDAFTCQLTGALARLECLDIASASTLGNVRIPTLRL